MNRYVRTAMVTGVCVLAGACSSYTMSENDKADHYKAMEGRSTAIVDNVKQSSPTLARFIKDSAAYVVFPDVTKGGVGIGGAHGEGTVYQGGKVIGYATLSQGTLGPQLGGQRYTEFVFFRTDADLARFKTGEFTFAAQASAVAAAKGDSVTADYSDGVAVFTRDEEGLMFEAVIGGQKFAFHHLSEKTHVS